MIIQHMQSGSLLVKNDAVDSFELKSDGLSNKKSGS